MINNFTKLSLYFLFYFCLNLDAGVAIFKQDNNHIQIKDSKKLSLLEENVSVALETTSAPFYLVTKNNELVWLSVQSHIKIRNLQDSGLTTTLGFPLCIYPKNLESHEKSYIKKSIFEKNLDKIKFNAVADDKTKLDTTFFLEDGKRLFCSIFLWEINLAPKEVQSFTVSYSVPLLYTSDFISGNLLRDSESIKLDSTTERLYEWLASCKNTFFSYAILNEYLHNENNTRVNIDFDLSMIFDKFEKRPGVWDCIYVPDRIKFDRYLIALLYPKPSKIDNKIIYWENPNESCFVYFKRTEFPLDASVWGLWEKELVAETAKWLNMWEKVYKDNVNISSGKWKQYYSDELGHIQRLKKYPFLERDLNDIYSVFIGKKVNNKNIHSFLKKQIWFSYSRLPINNWILLWE